MPLTIHNRIPRDDLALGLVWAADVTVAPASPTLSRELQRWVQRRAEQPLDGDEEALRRGCRHMLRNGRYKPTGRGKPASEYLMRAAGQSSFPRINGPVDANNLVSLRHCVPISLWDQARAGSHELELRLGHEQEAYVFNSAGQSLELRDLVCGCAVTGAGSVPRVTPIKDSLATKLQADSRQLCGCIYYPLSHGPLQRLEQATDELARWLGGCGPAVRTRVAICPPGATQKL